ncbi:hypothetical protein K501DRAFT_153775, partial [Backusella circina FSU 941]
LKRLQYMLSGDFRPLDVLDLEVSKYTNNDNVQRYLYMPRDCRQFLLNVTAQINGMCNNIAFQTMNPTFRSQSPNASTNYTMSPIDFQAVLLQ